MGLADYYGVGGGAPRKVTLPARSTRPLAPLRRQERKSSGGGRSIMGQIGDTLKALPAGIGHLASSGARTAWDSTIGRNVDMAFGDADDQRKALRSTIAAPDAVSLVGRVTAANMIGEPEFADEVYGDYAPLAEEYGTSLNATGMRLRHPSRYGKAIDESGIVGAILEDAGNIALIGGPASKVVTAAGRGATAAGMARTGSALTRAGAAGEQVAALGNAVGDAPFSLPRRAINTAPSRSWSTRPPLSPVPSTTLPSS
jgi:hypothetical protein